VHYAIRERDRAERGGRLANGVDLRMTSRIGVAPHGIVCRHDHLTVFDDGRAEGRLSRCDPLARLFDHPPHECGIIHGDIVTELEIKVKMEPQINADVCRSDSQSVFICVDLRLILLHRRKRRPEPSWPNSNGGLAKTANPASSSAWTVT